MLNTVATIGGPSEARSGSSGLYLEFKEHSLLAHNGPKPVRLVSRELPLRRGFTFTGRRTGLSSSHRRRGLWEPAEQPSC